jgi:DNA-binding transcriptional LysR family regulator
MDLRALRAFVEVVRQGGFTAAAKAVFATQSTVSKAVKQLEDEIGLPLLDRIGHRAVLTAAGEVVYRRALSMLAERDDLVAELAELRGLKRGALRIGLPPIGSDVLFAPVFAQYRSRYPGIEIQLVEHGSKRLEDMVRAGEIDLGGSLMPVPDEFAWQEVRCEPIDALVAGDHVLAHAGTVEMGALADQPFILFESGFALNSIILDACRRSGFTPTIAARSSQIDFIAALVAAGLGIGFLPRMIARQKPHPDVRHIGIATAGMNWHMAMIWRRGAYLPQAARAWLALLQESASTTLGDRQMAATDRLPDLS